MPVDMFDPNTLEGLDALREEDEQGIALAEQGVPPTKWRDVLNGLREKGASDWEQVRAARRFTSYMENHPSLAGLSAADKNNLSQKVLNTVPNIEERGFADVIGQHKATVTQRRAQKAGVDVTTYLQQEVEAQRQQQRQMAEEYAKTGQRPVGYEPVEGAFQTKQVDDVATYKRYGGTPRPPQHIPQPNIETYFQKKQPSPMELLDAYEQRGHMDPVRANQLRTFISRQGEIVEKAFEKALYAPQAKDPELLAEFRENLSPELATFYLSQVHRFSSPEMRKLDATVKRLLSVPDFTALDKETIMSIPPDKRDDFRMLLALNIKKLKPTEEQGSTITRAGRGFIQGGQALKEAPIKFWQGVTGTFDVTKLNKLDWYNETQAAIRSADPIEARNWLEQGVISTARMAPTIMASAGVGAAAGAAGKVAATKFAASTLGKSLVAKSPLLAKTIPWLAGGGGAKAGGLAFWYTHSVPQIYQTLRESGVQPEDAAGLSAIVGLPYAYIEQMQVKGLLPKVLTSEAQQIASRTAGKYVWQMLKQLPLQSVKEIAEEGGQSLVVSMSKQMAALIAGNPDVDWGMEIKDSWREMGEAAVPIIMLQLMGLASGVAMSGDITKATRWADENATMIFAENPDVLAKLQSAANASEEEIARVFGVLPTQLPDVLKNRPMRETLYNKAKKPDVQAEAERLGGGIEQLQQERVERRGIEAAEEPAEQPVEQPVADVEAEAPVIETEADVPADAPVTPVESTEDAQVSEDLTTPETPEKDATLGVQKRQAAAEVIQRTLRRSPALKEATVEADDEGYVLTLAGRKARVSLETPETMTARIGDKEYVASLLGTLNTSPSYKGKDTATINNADGDSIQVPVPHTQEQWDALTDEQKGLWRRKFGSAPLTYSPGKGGKQGVLHIVDTFDVQVDEITHDAQHFMIDAGILDEAGVAAVVAEMGAKPGGRDAEELFAEAVRQYTRRERTFTAKAREVLQRVVDFFDGLLGRDEQGRVARATLRQAAGETGRRGGQEAGAARVEGEPASAKPVLREDKDKQPWEMTQAEYLNAFLDAEKSRIPTEFTETTLGAFDRELGDADPVEGGQVFAENGPWERLMQSWGQIDAETELYVESPYYDIGAQFEWANLTPAAQRVVEETITDVLKESYTEATGKSWKNVTNPASKLYPFDFDEMPSELHDVAGTQIVPYLLAVIRKSKERGVAQFMDSHERLYMNFIRPEGRVIKDHMFEVLGALQDGDLTPARARELGHFDAYPDLAAKYGKDANPVLRESDTDRDALGMYSGLIRVASSFPQAKATAGQFAQWLDKQAGVKAEELSWSGLDAWLKGKGRVTRDEVVEFLRQHEVRVEEVVNTRGLPAEERLERIVEDALLNAGVDKFVALDTAVALNTRADGGHTYEEAVKTVKDQIAAPDDNGKTITSVLDSEPIRAAYESYVGKEDIDKTRYAQYQLPGGSNYREVLLVMPDPAVEAGIDLKASGSAIAARDARRAAGREQEFFSPHFDERNILAHVRFNERVMPDGKRVLFIEEVQSDWHQKGKKEGYAGTARVTVEPATVPTQLRLGNEWVVKVNGAEMSLTETREEADRIADDFRSGRRALPGLVPDAPFKLSWPELALKRMITWAADNGFDAIAWTTGEQQADRYDLSKHINEIHYSGTNLKAYNHDGQVVISQTGVRPEDLENIIGKEAAEKLIAQEPQGTLRSLVGEDLKVGGEGMKAFYDMQLPRVAAKLGKKYGAKVGETTIDASETFQRTGKPGEYTIGNKALVVHSLDISPKLADVASTEGLPRFVLRETPDVGKTETKVRRQIMGFELAQDELPVPRGMRETVIGKLKLAGQYISEIHHSLTLAVIDYIPPSKRDKYFERIAKARTRYELEKVARSIDAGAERWVDKAEFILPVDEILKIADKNYYKALNTAHLDAMFNIKEDLGTIVAFARRNLPTSELGKLLPTIKRMAVAAASGKDAARTQELMKAADVVRKIVFRYQQKKALARFDKAHKAAKEAVGGGRKQPKLEPFYVDKLKQIIEAIRTKGITDKTVQTLLNTIVAQEYDAQGTEVGAQAKEYWRARDAAIAKLGQNASQEQLDAIYEQYPELRFVVGDTALDLVREKDIPEIDAITDAIVATLHQAALKNTLQTVKGKRDLLDGAKQITTELAQQYPEKYSATKDAGAVSEIQTEFVDGENLWDRLSPTLRELTYDRIIEGWTEMYRVHFAVQDMTTEMLGEQGIKITPEMIVRHSTAAQSTMPWLHEMFNVQVRGHQQAAKHKVKLPANLQYGWAEQTIELDSATRMFLLALFQDPDRLHELVRRGSGGIVLWDDPRKRQGEHTIKLDYDRVQAIELSATPEEFKIVAAFRQALNSPYLRGQLNAASMKIFGHEVATHDDYWMSRRQHAKSEDVNTMSDLFGYIGATKLENWGNLKERTGGSQPIIAQDIYAAFFGHMNHVAKFVGLAEPLHQTRRVLANSDVRTEIEVRRGAKYYQDLLAYCDRVAGTKVSGSKTMTEKIARNVRNLAVKGTLMLRVYTGVVQAFSYAGVPFELGITDPEVLKGFIPDAKNIVLSKKMVDEMTEWMPDMRARFTGHAAQLLAPGMRGVGMLDYYLGAPKDYLMYHIKLGDKKGVAATYALTKRVWVKQNHPELANKPLEAWPEDVRNEFLRRARQVINRTQPTFDEPTLSKLASRARENPFLGFLTAFTSYTSKVYSMIVRVNSQARRGVISHQAAYALIAGLLLQAVVPKWFSDEMRRKVKIGFRESDPTYTTAKDRLWEGIERTTGMVIPYGGQYTSDALSLVRSAIDGRPRSGRGNVAESMLRYAGRAILDARKGISEEDAEKRNAAFESAMRNALKAAPGGGGAMDVVEIVSGALGVESYQSIKAAYRNAYADFHKSKESLRDRQQALNKAVTAIRKRAETAGIKNFKTIETSSKAWATRTLKAKKN